MLRVICVPHSRTLLTHAREMPRIGSLTNCTLAQHHTPTNQPPTNQPVFLLVQSNPMKEWHAAITIPTFSTHTEVLSRHSEKPNRGLLCIVHFVVVVVVVSPGRWSGQIDISKHADVVRIPSERESEKKVPSLMLAGWLWLVGQWRLGCGGWGFVVAMGLSVLHMEKEGCLVRECA